MSELILIVEDEHDLVGTLEYNLQKEGYQTRAAFNGHDALDAIATEDSETRPDLILLDLMLPDISGTEVCRRIRESDETGEIPIVMLTAKGDEADRVTGFESGADDYVVKPFSVRELLLRIEAILRRTQNGTADHRADEIYEFGPLEIDIPGHRVRVDEEPVDLTPLEFKLLKTFVERKGRAQSRDILLADVWDLNTDVETRTVDTHVKRLRNKLGEAGGLIETVRGVGYRFGGD